MAEARVIPLHGNSGSAPANNGHPAPARQAGRRRVERQQALAELLPNQANAGTAEQTAGPERPADPEIPSTPTTHLPADRIERLADLLAFLRRRLTGDYEIDEFGFDAELTDNVLLPPLRQLYQRWFRVEAIGAGNLPRAGGALLVANHSGTLPLDAVMTSIAVHDNVPMPWQPGTDPFGPPAGRHLRMLGADLVFRTPMMGTLARKSGQTLACNADAERLLRTGHLVGVWPEGFKGIGKPFRDRYKLQRFGRGGFVSAALRAGVPIVPCSIVGAEEIYPKIADLKPLARLFGFPYFPVTPFFPWLGPLGAIPLPSKWYIEFGEPISTEDYGPGAEEDPMLVFNLTDQVRENIQQTLYRLLSQRRNVFLG